MKAFQESFTVEQRLSLNSGSNEWYHASNAASIYHSQPIESAPNPSKLVYEPTLVNTARKRRTMNNEKANLYKTELCKKFMNTGACRYGTRCQFAHGHHELRTLIRHPLYKTTPCKTFQATGSCRYGSRCRFIHNETEQQLNSVPRLPYPQAQQQPSQPDPPAFTGQSTPGFSLPSNPISATINLQAMERPVLKRNFISVPASLNLLGEEDATEEDFGLGIGSFQDSSANELERSFQKSGFASSKTITPQRMKRNVTFHDLKRKGEIPILEQGRPSSNSLSESFGELSLDQGILKLRENDIGESSFFSNNLS